MVLEGLCQQKWQQPHNIGAVRVPLSIVLVVLPVAGPLC
jgi:hypothetical protein